MGDPVWLILEEASVHIPGDERSRTNPGHGYPAHTMNYMIVSKYSNKAKWLKAIEELERRTYGKKKYTAYKAYPASVTKKVSVNIDVEDASPERDYDIFEGNRG